jgi:hypothetical protein
MFFFNFISSFQILFKVEDAGEDVVNSEENDDDPGLLNTEEEVSYTVPNISPEVSKKVPHISSLV